jgi:hypothetical protein
MPLPGGYGNSFFGTGPFGSNFLPFGVTSATALNPGLVEITFSDPVDFSIPATLAPGNYTISPSLTVFSVTIETTQSVRLVTSPQSFVIYEVDVAVAQSLDGILISPVLNKAFFTGFPVAPSYFSVGTSPTRIRCVFSAPMLMNAALSDPLSYQVTDLQGVPLSINSAVPEQSVHPRSVLLTLGTPMKTTAWYQTILTGAIQTETLLSPLPTESVFQFVQPEASFNVDLDVFSGEVHGGLFGNPAGLVFFSPALQASIPNSVIQVDEVDVCTTAYDVYSPPSPPDPAPFYTWSPIGPQMTLGQSGITLWAPFPRLFEARFELTFPGTSLVEPMPEAVDGSCSILMREVWDHTYVALLNNPAWKLFDNTGMTTPPIFICANNLGPIPPGPEAITILHMGLGGNSSLGATAHRILGPTAVLVAGASVAANPTVV